MFLTGCSPDLGNYDYTQLNDVEISMPGQFSAILQEPFDVVPRLKAEGCDEKDYVFEWTAYPDDNGTPVVLSNDRDLHITMTLPAGAYTLVYTVSEKEGGFFYRSKAGLQVSTPFSEGWLVLCDEDGRVRLDMYSRIKDRLYTDILPAELHDLQDPLHLYYVNQRSVAESPFYLLTGDGTTRLSASDFAWKEEYRIAYEMGAEADRSVKPACMVVNGPGKVIVDTDGCDYYCNNIMGDGLYNQKRKNSFKVAPFVGCDLLSSHYVPAFLLFNQSTRNFVVCAEMFANSDLLGISAPSDIGLRQMYSLYGFPYANYSLFSIPDRTYDLMWMENTTYDPLNMGVGTTYAVMQNASATMLYGLALGDLLGVRYEKYGNSFTNIMSRDLSACTDIRQASHFAFSSLKNMMYYAVGGRIYRIGLSADNPVAELDIELPAGEEITCMKFYHCSQSANRVRSHYLLVGSVNGAGEGALRIYDGWSTEGVFTGSQPLQEIHGLARIKDVIYREIITEYEL